MVSSQSLDPPKREKQMIKALKEGEWYNERKSKPRES
jgi:hypothetical protein